VTRSLGLVSLLAVLVVGGYLYTRQSAEVAGSGGQVVQEAAVDAAANATLIAARTGVEAFAAANGTYAGAPVPTGVTLVAVDAASYCLQVGAAEATRHLTSPGSGQALPGPC
jgi:hypothetical protein